MVASNSILTLSRTNVLRSFFRQHLLVLILFPNILGLGTILVVGPYIGWQQRLDTACPRGTCGHDTWGYVAWGVAIGGRSRDQHHECIDIATTIVD